MGLTRRGLLALSLRLGALLALGSGSAFANAITPKRRQLDGPPISLVGSAVVANPQLVRQYGAAIRAFETALSVTGGPGMPIYLDYLPPGDASVPPDVAAELSAHPDSYAVSIGQGEVRITGANPAGALQGMNFVEAMILQQGGMTQSGLVIDWPDHAVRALHLMLTGLKVEDLRRVALLARRARFNTLIVGLADSVRYVNGPGIARSDALSWNELLSAIQFAEENGLRVIPHLPLLTHQELFLKNAYPGILYNRVTYNPDHPAIYQILFPIIDEVLAWLNPTALHIGHDEVAGLTGPSRSQWLAPGESPLPPEPFRKDVLTLYQFLWRRGVETWMWGDMLIAPEEFPQMVSGYCNGIQGYARLRSELPPGIVVCDWHYHGNTFPSAKAFVERGSPLLGATWEWEPAVRHFSRYVTGLPAPARGMIATTWYPLQKRDWERVARIIEVSGSAFWNAA